MFVAVTEEQNLHTDVCILMQMHRHQVCTDTSEQVITAQMSELMHG